MEGEPECKGKIRVGPIPWEVSEILTQFSGGWLAFDPAECAIVARPGHPGRCPALSGVPCELITLIDSIPQEQRDSMPGGALYVKDKHGRTVRLTVEHGEVRIRWPHLDYSRAQALPAASFLQAPGSRNAKVRGWARFAGAPARATELREFAERFGGLYPEEDIPSECPSDMVYVEFQDVTEPPDELIARMQELAEPRESLQAEMELAIPAPGGRGRDLRICIRDGQVQVLRPALWSED